MIISLDLDSPAPWWACCTARASPCRPRRPPDPLPCDEHQCYQNEKGQTKNKEGVYNILMSNVYNILMFLRLFQTNLVDHLVTAEIHVEVVCVAPLQVGEHRHLGNPF